MLIFLIAVGIIILVIVVGAVLAGAFSRMDTMVTETQKSVQEAGKGYKPALSLGFAIDLDASPEAQVHEARRLAAQKAAALPRGANMGIGRLGHSNLKTAFAGVREDPLTAAKMAVIHGWDGVRTGPGAATAVAAPTAAAAPAAAEINLVPGKDYPVIAITDDMSDADKRKARIENSKAKSRALKAAKEAQKAGGAAPQTAAPTAAAPAAAAVAPAAAAGIAEPNYIEITDSMPPDEVRKARIHNAKERSKYNKALKAAGVDPDAAGAPASAPASAAAAPQQPAAVAQPAATPDAALAGIPQPDYIEITDTMPADEVRKARIHNAKERSKYNKALKAAGIDPASVG